MISLEHLARRVALSVALVAGCGGGGGERDAPPPASDASLAFVVTSDFDAGSFAVVPLDDPSGRAVNVARLHSDAVVRVHDGIVYVLNRLGGDNVQALDPADGFRTLWQCSVGNGSNPHDFVVVAPDKAYVTRYEEPTLLVVDPSAGERCTGFVVGEIDLGAFADDDGIPEMDQMAVVDGRLFVSLQRLSRRNFFVPTDASLLAVVDIASDALVDADPSTPVVDAIWLSSTNPFSDFQPLLVDPVSGKLAVNQVGSFGVIGDGGVELVDPVALRAEGFFIGEAELGGNVTDFVLIDERRAYAVVSDLDFVGRVVRFDRLGREVVATLHVSEEFIADLEHEPGRDELWLADRSLASPGLRVFGRDAAGADVALHAGPIDTGLPPFDLVFLR